VTIRIRFEGHAANVLIDKARRSRANDTGVDGLAKRIVLRDIAEDILRLEGKEAERKRKAEAKDREAKRKRKEKEAERKRRAKLKAKLKAKAKAESKKARAKMLSGRGMTKRARFEAKQREQILTKRATTRVKKGAIPEGDGAPA
jgi:hypothetical protein